MRNITLSTILLLWCHAAYAQGTASSLVSSGTHFENEHMSLSWNIGELITDTWFEGSEVIAHGVLQPDNAITVTSIQQPVAGTSSVYPNPFEQFVQIDFHDLDSGYSFQLFDVDGILLDHGKINRVTSHRIDLADYAEGFYLLVVTKKQSTEFFKLLKSK